MANYNGQNFTSFSGVNVKNTIALRMQGDSGFVGTVAMRAAGDADRAYNFPDKSGTFPIMGTFRVQLAAATTAEFSTIVTVAGIRSEDALVVQFNGVGLAGTTYGFDNSTGYIITQSVPGNGNITLFMQNPGNATAYVDLQASYLAMR